jgi:beta-fructofuranosidase
MVSGKSPTEFSATWDLPLLWCHARSKELVYWEHLPMALAPTPGGPDKGGCWTGSAFTNNRVPTVVYKGVFPQVQCLATSDEDMITCPMKVQLKILSLPQDGPV